MSDTPPPDIPDPASPTPIDPAPKPRRVITRPDTAIRAPLPGTRVITRPDAAKSARLPGTYAENYGGDPNWKRGVTMLWTLFGLAALAEFFRALIVVLQGNAGWPYPGDLARLCVEGLIFVFLWFGWSWSRWVLVAVNFAFGAWFIIRSVAPLPTDLMAAHPEIRQAQGLGTAVQLALGGIYLVSAGYLAFAADVIGFTRHRREEGRGWVVVPLIILVAAWIGLTCSLVPSTKALFERWHPEAQQFAVDSLRAMSEHWDVATYDQRADADYLKVWTEDQRKPTFGTLAGIGPVQTLGEVQTSEGVPGPTRGGGGFLVRYHCTFGKVRFAHGSMIYGCYVSRRLPGPWKLENLEVSQLENDPEPSGPGTAAPAEAAPTPTPSIPPPPPAL